MFKVYMPYSDHLKSVACFDDDLLWNQLHDAALLCRALAEKAPNTMMLALKQWRGYEGWLALYVRRMQVEAQKRDLGMWEDDQRNSPYARSWLVLSQAGKSLAAKAPRWVGGHWFLESNRSELIRISPEHYAHQFPATPMEMPFLYPQNTPGSFDYTISVSQRDWELMRSDERVIPEQFMEHVEEKWN